MGCFVVHIAVSAIRRDRKQQSLRDLFVEEKQLILAKNFGRPLVRPM